jgi:hypothetical protein
MLDTLKLTSGSGSGVSSFTSTGGSAGRLAALVALGFFVFFDFLDRDCSSSSVKAFTVGSLLEPYKK